MKSPKEMKDLYDEKYVAAYEAWQPLSRLERLVRFLAVNESDRVADFACGNGMLMPLIAPKVKSYIGVDFSGLFIQAADERKKRLSIPNAEFVCSDIEEFCLRHPTSFDAGFAMDFSEHVEDEEWLRMLKSIRSSIKPGGKLYLHTPNAEFFLEKMKKRNFIFKQFPQHVAVRSPAENVDMLQRAGFTVAAVRMMPHYNILRLVHPISYIPFVGKYFKARIFIEATR